MLFFQAFPRQCTQVDEGHNVKQLRHETVLQVMKERLFRGLGGKFSCSLAVLGRALRGMIAARFGSAPVHHAAEQARVHDRSAIADGVPDPPEDQNPSMAYQSVINDKDKDWRLVSEHLTDCIGVCYPLDLSSDKTPDTQVLQNIEQRKFDARHTFWKSAAVGV